MKCDEEISDFIDFSKENTEDEDMIKFSNALFEKSVIKSALHIDVYKENSKEFSSVLVASKAGVIAKGSSISELKRSKFIPASAKLPNYKLAESFDIARLDDTSDIVLKAIQLIDKSIESIETFNIGRPNLYLKRIGEKRMPLSLFGDAINKVVNITLCIVNNPNSVVLIDEIENGIHYTNQEKLWKMLFDLAIDKTVQLFITSHSYEMIKAFAKVAQEFPEKTAYFEMARHYKTKNIIGTSIPIDDLKYYIESNSPFRGD